MTDSLNRDETRDRRREEALARRVGEALDQLAHRDAKDCPDAELLAAYQEKALQPEEIARWEGHFAVCARCRKVLLVLAASVGTPLDEQEVARLGKLVATARSPLETNTGTQAPNPRIRLNWRVRWLAPALGVAAVLAVWFAMRPPWRVADQNSPGALIAQAPREELPQQTETRDRQQSAEAAPGKSAKGDREVLKDSFSRRSQSFGLPADSVAKTKKDLDSGGVAGENSPNSSVAESTLRDEKKEKAESNSAQSAGSVAGAISAPAPAARLSTAAPVAAPPLPPSAPLPQAKAEVVNQAPRDKEMSRSASQSVTRNESAPMAGAASGTSDGARQNSTGADLPANGQNYLPLMKLNSGAEVYVLVKTPSAEILWGAGKGGNIERSTDAGRTWVSQISPLQEDWIAGAAVSETVCWIAGRNGAIALTTDANHWTKIAPPPMAADSSQKLPDWTGIAAVDARKATITASDGRRFATENAGKTWKAQ